MMEVRGRALAQRRHVEPVEQVGEGERGDALGRRRHLHQSVAAIGDGEGRRPARAEGGEILGGERRTARADLGRDLRPDRVVIVARPVPRDAFQGRGEGGVAHRVAGSRRPAPRHVDARHRRPLAQRVGGDPLGDRSGARRAVARRFDGGREQKCPVEPAVPLVRQAPAVDRAGHGQRGARPALRDRAQPMAAIPLDARRPPRRPGRLDALGPAGGRVPDQPEPVAAQPAHVGIADRQHGVGRDRRVDRAAARGKHRRPGGGRRCVRGRHHPVRRVYRFRHQRLPPS